MARRAGQRAVASTGQPARPLEEAQRGRRRHRDGHPLQARPGQCEGHRRKRPPPARRVAHEETHGQQQQPQHEQHQGRFQAQQHAAPRIEGRQHGEQQEPRQPRHPRRHGDQRHAASDEHDLERLDGEQRLGLVEHPVQGREQEQPQRVVAVGAGDAAVEGREPPLGHVVGDLEVVERVVVAHVPQQVDEVEAVEHVPGEARPVAQDADHEQREQRVRNARWQPFVKPRRPTPAPRTLRDVRLLQAPSVPSRRDLRCCPSRFGISQDRTRSPFLKPVACHASVKSRLMKPVDSRSSSKSPPDRRYCGVSRRPNASRAIPRSRLCAARGWPASLRASRRSAGTRRSRWRCSPGRRRCRGRGRS